MSHQDVVDEVSDALPSYIPNAIKEKILDAVWTILHDNLPDPADEAYEAECAKDIPLPKGN